MLGCFIVRPCCVLLANFHRSHLQGRVKSVLKKAGGGGGGATGTSARKAPRKISFAPGAGEEEGIEESEEEVEEPREGIEVGACEAW